MKERAKVRYVKINDRAIVPTFGTEYAAGADLYVLDSAEILPGETCWFNTGIAVEIPTGYVGLIFARSSLGTKRGLAPANMVGVVDSDYRGEIRVVLRNYSNVTQRVEASERVAQLVIVPYLSVDYVEATELDETCRGENGFGSTGKF